LFSNWRVRLPFGDGLAGFVFAEGQTPLFNENHELVKQGWRAKLKSEPTQFETFASTLLLALSRPEVTKLIANRSEQGPTDPRALKALGHMYEALDWSQIPPPTKPPYLVWLDGPGVTQITKEDFRRWGKLQYTTLRRRARRG
jgi:hypothetical protein